jgi:hypothetical protein
MSDDLKEMIERRKDHAARLRAEQQVLERVAGFRDGLLSVLSDVVVDVECRCDGQVSILIDVGKRDDEDRAVVGDHLEITTITPDLGRIKLPEDVPYKTGEWSDEEMSELRRLNDAGKTIAEISGALHRRGPGISAKLRAIKRQDEAVSEAMDVGPEVSDVSGDRKGFSSSQPDPVVAGNVGAEVKASASAETASASFIRAPHMIPYSEAKLARDYTQAEWINHIMAVRRASSGGPWSQEADIALVEALAAGDGISGALERLGEEFDRSMVISRWKTLCPQVTLKNQERLLKALRGLA